MYVYAFIKYCMLALQYIFHKATQQTFNAILLHFLVHALIAYVLIAEKTRFEKM